MRLHAIRLRGLGPFREEVVLDVDAIDGDLVAVAGDVGEGKSTLLEAWPGILHPRRRTPTRGTFEALADGHSRDAFVDVDFSYGAKRIRIRTEVKRERADVWVDGERVETDGKVSKLAEWAARNLLPMDVMTRAVFLPQRSEGIVEAGGPERREQLLLAIGIAEIEGWAAKARKRAGTAEKDLEAARSTLAADRRAAALLSAAQARHAKATSEIAVAEARRDTITAQLADARALREAYQAREAERTGIIARRGAAERRQADAAGRVAALNGRLREQEALVADATGIRERAARARAARAGAAAAGTRESAALAAGVARAEEAARDHQIIAAAQERAKAAMERQKAAESVLATRALVEEAVAALPGAIARREQEAAALRAAEESLAAAHRDRADVAAGRISALRGGLEGVERAARVADARSLARQTLRADDTAAAPPPLDDLGIAITAARGRLDAARAEAEALGQLAARAEEIAAAGAAQEAATADLAAAEREERMARWRAQEARSRAQAAASQAKTAGEEAVALAAEAEALAGAEEQEQAIAGAEARVAEIREQLAGARGDLVAAESEAAVIPALPDRLPAPPGTEAEAELAVLARSLASLGTEVQLAAVAVTAAREAEERVRQGEAALPALEENLADWTLLAECLGITGVQALEIDAAGPALTQGMNDFLHESYGTRFTAEVRATRPAKDGGKEIDEAEIRVTDTLKGRVGDVRTYSGGERVHLATSFFASLARYVCTNRRLVSPTLVFDEPGAGLGEIHVAPWVDMVRAAGRRAGASKVIVITHHPRIIDAADAVVRVKDGRVYLER